MASKISLENASNIARKSFNISAVLKVLPGDEDENFKVETRKGDCFILKISAPEVDVEFLNFQNDILKYLESKSLGFELPKIVSNTENELLSDITTEERGTQKIRLLTWIDGRLWTYVNPKTKALRQSLAEQAGKLTSALQDFDHKGAHRNFDWNLSDSAWTIDYVELFSEKDREIIEYFQKCFSEKQVVYQSLPKSVIHNDVNDYNILVSHDLRNPKVTGIIDFGDAVYAQTINDLAVLLAYAIMDVPNPLGVAVEVLKGYNSQYSISEKELECLYSLVAMRLVTTVTKAAIRKVENPENEYHIISEKPAWEVLHKWHSINSEFALFNFRKACNFSGHPTENDFQNWANENDFNVSELFPTIKCDEIHHLDLSVSSKWIGHQEDFNDIDLFQFKIEQLQKKHPSKILAGGYLEPRPLYTSSEYDKLGNLGPESRTVHLGVDFWLPAQTPVHALFDGEIMIATNDAGDKEYGGLVVLKHRIDDLVFYTLYGHLTVSSATKHSPGDNIKKGECIAVLGNPKENGNWAPHLHFQIMLSLLDYKIDFPGVAYHNEIQVWNSLCPDPNLLFKSEALKPKTAPTNADIIAYRKQYLGKGLSLQYEIPIKMVRGAGPFLMDQFGRKYLDTVNNVAHVGHEHPAVVKAGQEQMALINTNSRYLHDSITDLAIELLETLPPEISVLHFVNSGSEANELAIRMVKAATGERDIIASEVGYHGNSNMCIDISSYKFDGKGGQGAPEFTHIFPLPDSFRGKYRGENTSDKYSEEVQKQVDIIHKKRRGVGAFIIEPIISCGGQIELPEGFLEKSYEIIRAAGGLCISDEVQTGCGRMGKTFWGFQLHTVIPDIVTIGKPLGNGHPIAAVACTREVADKFANGMEYFNTFGGNPVSCAIGTEVLRTIKREKLQENALEVGEFLKAELKKLAMEFNIIGDVRGQGLFLGIELVDKNLKPLKEQTNYLANRMKDHGILMSIDGPDNNVLKIKPPMIFNKANAKELIFRLQQILAEDFMNHFN